MAGTLEINERYCWMPAGWLFDHALEAIAARVGLTDSALGEELRHFRTESGGYGDLKGLDGQRFQLFREAVQAARDAAFEDGPAAFAKPEFFPGYLGQLDALLQGLRTDPRSG